MRVLLVLVLLSCASPLWAATYYIDNTTDSGSDAYTSTQAQSKSTPWKHLPGMKSATGAAAAYHPAAGDILVLRGGVTWHNADLPVTWNWSGTSGSKITVTTDATWYFGGSWSRPIWNADGSVIVGPRVLSGWNVNTFIDTNNSNFGVHDVIFDNIEMTGFYWIGFPPGGACGHILGSVSTSVTLDHLYIHGWGHGSLNAPDNTRAFCYGVRGSSNTPFNNGSVIQNSIIDGSDTTNGGDSLGALYLWPNVINNIIHHTTSAVVGGGSASGGSVTISGNLFYSMNNGFDTVTVEHPNVLELLGSTNNTKYYIYNNVFRDSPSGAESGYFANNSGGPVTYYIWNNLWYNMTGNPPQFEHDTKSHPDIYFWNNTLHMQKAGGVVYCMQASTKTGGTTAITSIQNNHCISNIGLNNGVSPLITATALTVDHNLLQTPTAATAEGYTTSQSPYVFYPTTGGSTIGTGINLAANCATIAGLCSDTAYSATEGANHTVVVGARTTFSRPGTTAWDIGAYSFANASPIPAAPSGLQLLHTTSTRTTLIWSPNTETNLVGYNVYCGAATGVYEAAPVKTNTAASVAATHSSMTAYHIQKSKATPLYCIVKAYNSDGTESAASSEVNTTFTGVSRSARQ